MPLSDTENAPYPVAQLFQRAASLLRGEMTLAHAELSQNATRARVGLYLICAATAVAAAALVILATALVEALEAISMPSWAAALIIGGAMLAGAIVLAALGKKRISRASLLPERTLHNLRRDADMIKEATGG